MSKLHKYRIISRTTKEGTWYYVERKEFFRWRWIFNSTISTNYMDIKTAEADLKKYVERKNDHTRGAKEKVEVVMSKAEVYKQRVIYTILIITILVIAYKEMTC